MIRKALILSCFSFLLVGESIYFGRASIAAVLRLAAERAFFRNDHRSAWKLYRDALAWGGDQDRLEIDLVELIVFGLDQVEAGVKIELPLPPEQSIPLAHALLARRLRETPYKAYCWSLVSDVYTHEARYRRRATVLDLATLSEDPLGNLLPEDRRALDALETATLLEPKNYIYHDLLMDLYQSFGSIPKAAEACRRSVRAFPRLDGHVYLLRPDLAPEMLEAGVAGFDDALRDRSLVPEVDILCDAGRVLAWHGDDARAEPYFSKALKVDPDHYDSLMGIAMLRLRHGELAGALEVLQRASRILPEEANPDYHAGVAHMALGQTDLAIADFQSAREKGYVGIDLFHALGAALESRGRIKEAERQFTAAANLHPQAAEAWSTLLEFHLRHGNLRSAVEVCEKLAQIHPGRGIPADACASLGGQAR